MTAISPTSPGLDALRAGLDAATLDFLKSRRAALLTNHTGVAQDGTPTLDVLRELKIEVSALFSPEHGPQGIEEGAIESSTHNGLPLFSLYGTTRRATPEMLDGLDVLICDLQDVGARFYTYATTLAYCLEACAPPGIAVVVLDRPNPIGGAIEGPRMHDECRSFVGHLDVPIRHGLTIGELARLHCADKDLDIDLRIVEVQNWRREMMWPHELTWPIPSPNLPDPNSALWYPGLCLLEFCDVSVGRGTDAPFQIVGAPWMQPEKVLRALANRERERPASLPPNLQIEPIEFTPTRATWANELCRGLKFSMPDKTPPAEIVPLGLALLAALHATHSQFDDAELDKALPLLGSPEVLQKLKLGDVAAAIELCRANAEEFAIRRQAFLIYG